MNSQMLSSSMQKLAVAPRATVRASACPLLRPVAQMRGLAQHPHARAFTAYAQTKLHAQLTSSKLTRKIFTLQSVSLYHPSLVLTTLCTKGCYSVLVLLVYMQTAAHVQMVLLQCFAKGMSDAVLCGAGSSRRGVCVVAARSEAGAWQSATQCV